MTVPYKKWDEEISFSPDALKLTGSLEQACILGFLAKKLTDPKYIVVDGDGVYWVQLSKKAFVTECLIHLEGKDLKSVDRYLEKLESGQYIRKSWRHSNPARDAAWWTFGPEFRKIGSWRISKFCEYPFA